MPSSILGSSPSISGMTCASPSLAAISERMPNSSNAEASACIGSTIERAFLASATIDWALPELLQKSGAPWSSSISLRRFSLEAKSKTLLELHEAGLELFHARGDVFQRCHGRRIVGIRARMGRPQRRAATKRALRGAAPAAAGGAP